MSIVSRAVLALARFLDNRGTAWCVGVIMPVAMLLLDPIVFRGGTIGFEMALLGRYRTACYLTIGVAVTALVIVLTIGRARAFLSGTMAAAAALGVLLGLVILPFSLIGTLFMGVGLLGFSPFLAAAVFARWSYRSLRSSSGSRRYVSAFAGVLALSALGLGTQVTVSHVLDSSISDIVSPRLRRSRAATERLKRWRLFVDMDQFIPAWQGQADPEAKQRLANAYQAITGENLEEHVMRAAD